MTFQPIDCPDKDGPLSEKGLKGEAGLQASPLLLPSDRLLLAYLPSNLHRLYLVVMQLP